MHYILFTASRILCYFDTHKTFSQDRKNKNKISPSKIIKTSLVVGAYRYSGLPMNKTEALARVFTQVFRTWSINFKIHCQMNGKIEKRLWWTPVASGQTRNPFTRTAYVKITSVKFYFRNWKFVLRPELKNTRVKFY